MWCFQISPGANGGRITGFDEILALRADAAELAREPVTEAPRVIDEVSKTLAQSQRIYGIPSLAKQLTTQRA